MQKMIKAMLLLLVVISAATQAQTEIAFSLGYQPSQHFVEDQEERVLIELRDLAPGYNYSDSSTESDAKKRSAELLSLVRKRVEASAMNDAGGFEVKVFIEANRSYLVGQNDQLIEVDQDASKTEGLSFLFAVLPDKSYELLKSWHEQVEDFDTSVVELILRQLYENKALAPVALKLGDVHTVVVPVAYPMPGIGQFSMQIQQEYQLNSLEGGRAHFDISAEFRSLVDLPSQVVEVYGFGKGGHVYHVETGLHEISHLELDLNLYIHQGDSVTGMKMKSFLAAKVQSLR